MKYALIPILVAALTAQAPPPAAAPPAGAPLLSLDYAFDFKPAGFSPGVVSGESGVAGSAAGMSSTGSGGGVYMVAAAGMLHVGVMGHATDGGIIVRIDQQIDGPPSQHAPTHSLTCEIFSGGNVSCTQPPYGASFYEDVLLPLLTPTFFALDGKGPTKVYFIEQAASALLKTQSDVTLTSSPDAEANKLDYSLNETTSLRGASLHAITGKATGSIVVDQSIHLPVRVNYSWQDTSTTGDASDQYTVQLSLKSVQ